MSDNESSASESGSEVEEGSGAELKQEKGGPAKHEKDETKPSKSDADTAPAKSTDEPDVVGKDSKKTDAAEDKATAETDNNAKDEGEKETGPDQNVKQQSSEAKPEDKADAKPEAMSGPATESVSSTGDTVVVAGVTISDITDQDKLHEMLEQCDNFDERRKIRARLMTLMQEARGKEISSEGNAASATVASKTPTSKAVTSSPRTQPGKGKAAVSPFDKFKQLDSANPKAMPRTDSNNSEGSGGFKLDPGLAAKAQGAKEMTLYWVQSRVRDYKNVNVSNFSTSWNDGMAFCALIHHFYPDAFDYDKLDPKKRRYNFDLAFKTADEKAGIYPLLDTDDMVMMKKPDWKCVFTYVQAIYRRLKDGP